MDLLNQSAFLKALGWSLLNSFWQFGLLWLLFILINAGKKTFSATLKHAFAVVLLLIGFAWFSIGLSYKYFTYSTDKADVNSIQAGYADSELYNVLTGFLENNLSYISAIYLFVVAILFIKFFRYFYYSHKIQTQGLIKIKAELRLYVEQMSVILDLKKKVQVWLSQHVDTPIIVGFLKPTILIPVACMNQLTIHQLEAVILHELAHIKRNDYLLNLFLAITEIVFFFNPFSRLFTRIIQQERENSCDDWVLQFKFDRYEYASALLSLEKNRATYFPLTIAVTGTNKQKTLLSRIQRILQVKVSNQVNRLKLFASFLSVILLSVVALFNPGNVVMRKIAMEFPPVNRVWYAVTEINQPAIKNRPEVEKHQPVKKQEPQMVNNPTEETVVEQGEMPDLSNEMLFVNVADLAAEGFDHTNRLIAAVKHETIEFSKTDNIEPIVPEVTSSIALPFVPSSSFSYFFVDTSKPKLKAESYYERNARASMVKAKKAVEQLDWKKIEKQLNNKVNIDQLRKEIEKSLENVNWQQINEEVNITLAKENKDKMNLLRQEAEEVTRYKAQQIQLQRVENELNLRREYLQKDVEKQQEAIKELQKQQRKKSGKIIVYI